jgi:putative tricarboxylic transport membrane protein
MRSDLAVAAILLALAGYIFVAAGAMPFGTARVPQTAFFPKCLAILLAVLSLIALVRAFIGIKDTFASGEIAARGWLRIGATLAVLIGFALVLEPLGFLASTFLLMLLLLRAIEPQPWHNVIVIALATSLVSYGLFAWLLGVPLPTGVLGI